MVTRLAKLNGTKAAGTQQGPVRRFFMAVGTVLLSGMAPGILTTAIANQAYAEGWDDDAKLSGSELEKQEKYGKAVDRYLKEGDTASVVRLINEKKISNAFGYSKLLAHYRKTESAYADPVKQELKKLTMQELMDEAAVAETSEEHLREFELRLIISEMTGPEEVDFSMSRAEIMISEGRIPWVYGYRAMKATYIAKAMASGDPGIFQSKIAYCERKGEEAKGRPQLEFYEKEEPPDPSLFLGAGAVMPKAEARAGEAGTEAVEEAGKGAIKAAGKQETEAPDERGQRMPDPIGAGFVPGHAYVAARKAGAYVRAYHELMTLEQTGPAFGNNPTGSLRNYDSIVENHIELRTTLGYFGIGWLSHLSLLVSYDSFSVQSGFDYSDDISYLTQLTEHRLGGGAGLFFDLSETRGNNIYLAGVVSAPVSSRWPLAESLPEAITVLAETQRTAVTPEWVFSAQLIDGLLNIYHRGSTDRLRPMVFSAHGQVPFDGILSWIDASSISLAATAYWQQVYAQYNSEEPLFGYYDRVNLIGRADMPIFDALKKVHAFLSVDGGMVLTPYERIGSMAIGATVLGRAALGEMGLTYMYDPLDKEHRFILGINIPGNGYSLGGFDVGTIYERLVDINARSRIRPAVLEAAATWDPRYP